MVFLTLLQQGMGYGMWETNFLTLEKQVVKTVFEFLATLFYKSYTALKAIENIIMEIAFNLRIHKNLPNTYRIY